VASFGIKAVTRLKDTITGINRRGGVYLSSIKLTVALRRTSSARREKVREGGWKLLRIVEINGGRYFHPRVYCSMLEKLNLRVSKL